MERNFLLMLILPNVWAMCPNGCVCTDNEERETKCNGSQITDLPSLLDPRTKLLSISNSRINMLDADTLELYPELEYLDLSNNEIETLRTGLFRCQNKLLALYLNGNKIARIERGAFTGLNALQVIDLSSNRLSLLEPLSFQEMSNLMEINLSNNLLNYIEQGVFHGLDHLRLLKISFNRLQAVNFEMLAEIPRVQGIDASHNLISRISFAAFSQQSELRWLDLSSNLISAINESSFIELNSIQRLNLSNNMIHQISDINIQQLSSLEVLDISWNSLIALTTSSFEGLSSLQHLNLSHQQYLKEIQLNAFSGLSSLNSLDLSYCKQLQKIDEHAFEIRSQLRHFDLSHCSLRSLSEALIDWNRLSSLKLAGNPLHCDSNLLSFLPNLLKKLSISDMKCSTPEDVLGWRIDLMNSGSSSLNDYNIIKSILDHQFLLIIVSCTTVTAILLVPIFKIYQRMKSSIKKSYKPDLPHNRPAITDTVGYDKRCAFKEVFYSPSEFTASTSSTFEDTDHYTSLMRQDDPYINVNTNRSNERSSIYSQNHQPKI